MESKFEFDWVLKNKLALGSAPKLEENIISLKKNNVKFILNLCSENEYKVCTSLTKSFKYKRYSLPDHKSKRNIEFSEIIECIKILKSNYGKGPIFVHCLASIERSPIICLAWLIFNNKINFEDAYIYLSQKHKITNPLNRQLKVIMDNQHKLIELNF